MLDKKTSVKPENVTNELFIRKVYGDDYSRAMVTGFPNPVTSSLPRRVWRCYEYRDGGQAKISDAQNNNNYGVISTFNRVQGQPARRRKALHHATHLIMLDDVFDKVDVGILQQKFNVNESDISYRLETSPGNEQWGLILKAPETRRWAVEQLLNGMVEKGLCIDGSDPGMKGVTRYYRLPCGVNTKPKYVEKLGHPFKHVLKSWHPERRYTVDELAQWFGIDLVEPEPLEKRLEAIQRDDDNDPVLQALIAEDLVIEEDASKPGMYHVECLFCNHPEHGHTGGDTSGTAYFTPGASDGSGTAYARGGVCCHHGHGDEMTLRVWEEELRRRGYDIPDRDVKAQDEMLDTLALDTLFDGQVEESPKPMEIDALWGDTVTIVRSSDGAGVEKTGDKVIDEMNARFALVTYKGKKRFLDESIFDDEQEDAILDNLMVSADFQIECEDMPSVLFGETAKGDPKYIPRSKYWRQDPRRRKYKNIVFNPAIDGHYDGNYNMWSGWNIKGLKQGNDWSRLKNHIHDVIADNDEQVFEYILDWLADALQNPHKKPGVAFIVKGKTRTGKSKLFEWFGKLYGRLHFASYNQSKRLTGNFNAHLATKLLVVLQEALFAGGIKENNVLKDILDGTILSIEPKGLGVTDVPNYIRVAMTSNEEWVVPMMLGGDGRNFIVHVNDSRQKDYSYFAAMDEQMESGGLYAMFNELINRDLSEANIRNFPKTKESTTQIDFSLKTHQKFIRDSIASESLSLNEFNRISKSALFQNYLVYCDELKERRPLDQRVFGREVKQMIESVSTNQKMKHIDGTWVNAYQFPDYQQCRKEFEIFLGVDEYDWD